MQIIKLMKFVGFGLCFREFLADVRTREALQRSAWLNFVVA